MTILPFSLHAALAAVRRERDAAFRRADRRAWLGKWAAPCPACGSPQVQLTDSTVQPAQWKCRTCKHPFTYEPPEKAP